MSETERLRLRRLLAEFLAGARAIAKKLGHAFGQGRPSAFSELASTQGNAEAIIRETMTKPTRAFFGSNVIDIYNATGQGVRIQAETNQFVGFLEGDLATQ